jgi:hypothetical protein
MDIQIVTTKVSLSELRNIAKVFHKSMIKGVVDIENEIIAFGGEYHMDANNVLIDNGSSQANLWGFNIIFEQPRELWIEYTSLINIRPQAKNFDMEVQDESVREKMRRIINSKVL